jgi:hypothetical protein
MQVMRGAAVWCGEDLASTTDWIVPLTDDVIRELETMARRALADGMTVDNLELRDEPSPALANFVAAIDRELNTGRGFILLRGLPLQRYAQDEIGAIYAALGACLGTPVSQSAEGDRLGHVIDRGLGDTGRYYNRGGQLEFHMDPVDVVGLLCLQMAMSGGASRIASSMAAHNVMLDERPDLVEILYRGFHVSQRAVNGPVSKSRVPVFAEGTDGLQCYYLPAQIRHATEEGHPLSAPEQEALKYLADVVDRPEMRLDMDLREGDIQFLNNRRILHARTDYVDHPDRAKWRHLLRLWLMMPQWSPRAEAMVFQRSTDRGGGGVRPAVHAS